MDIDYDQDGDGFIFSGFGGTDCDDTDSNTYPGATDSWYDGIDSNCDGANDYDQDGDGFTSVDHGGTDCDDMDLALNPGATEIWYDGIDQIVMVATIMTKMATGLDWFFLA